MVMHSMEERRHGKYQFMAVVGTCRRCELPPDLLPFRVICCPALARLAAIVANGTLQPEMASAQVRALILDQLRAHSASSFSKTGMRTVATSGFVKQEIRAQET